MNSFNVKARHKARRFILQAIYQWQMSDGSIRDIEIQYLDEMAETSEKKVDVNYFTDLIRGISANLNEIDGLINPILDRPVEELTPVELAVLRIAVYELKYRLDVPGRVVINEALELSKTFGSVDGYKYVNGVLDKIARELRPVEVANKK